MAIGRPKRQWTEETEDEICVAISTTDYGLEHICRERNLPDPAFIYRHLNSSPSFRQKYARARENQAQLLADQIIAIADATQDGVIVTEKGDGTKETKRADMIEHRKLRIEARKWLAMKLLPKIYGERLAHTGADGTDLTLTVRHVSGE